MLDPLGYRHRLIEEYNSSNFIKHGELSILHVNIRSISCNINKLEAFVFRLKNKPDVIICSEAWLPFCHGCVNIHGYDYYTNESKINRSDATVLYVKHILDLFFYIENFGNLKTVNIDINLNSNKIKISGLYRRFSYNIHNFTNDIKSYISVNKN